MSAVFHRVPPSRLGLSFYARTVHIVLYLEASKVTGHALYDRLLIGFAPRRSAKVNLRSVYDRKKLLTEIGDAPISRLACLVAIVDRILAVADQKPADREKERQREKEGGRKGERESCFFIFARPSDRLVE